MNAPHGWTRTRGGTLRRTLEGPGVSVTLFDKRSGGSFYRAVWDRGARRWDRKCLGTSEPAEAERLGRELLARLLVAAPPQAESGPVTLPDLWDRYSRTAPDFLDNAATSREDAAFRARCLLAHFGAAVDVATLTPDDLKSYAARRRTGGLVLESGRSCRPVRAKSVAADLALLGTMCRWAVTMRTAAGTRWLAENPLAGFRLPHEKNPRRPLATWDRFTATREAIGRLGEGERSESRRQGWTMLEMALTLAEATGRRRGAILALRWEDVDFTAGLLRWRAEADKTGQDWLVPMAPELAEALRAYRVRMGAAHGWLFPAWKDSAKSVHARTLTGLLAHAERAAKLPKLDGGLWHPYRRKWATERKAHAIKDVMAAGGWRNPATLLASYQQADSESVLAVVMEPRKLRDRAAAGA